MLRIDIRLRNPVPKGFMDRVNNKFMRQKVNISNGEGTNAERITLSHWWYT